MQVAKGFINRLPSRSTGTPRFIFSASKRVSAEISNVMQGSEAQSRGRCYATSVPSEDSKPKKVHKKVSMVERKAMVEAFVNKYREFNAGKFPAPTNVQKVVGGSFYTVKKIVQEIQYNFKVSPSETNNQNTSTTESTDKKETLAAVEKVISIHLTTDLELQTALNVQVNDVSHKSLQVSEGFQKNTLVEKPLPLQDVESQTTDLGLQTVLGLEVIDVSENYLEEDERLQRNVLVGTSLPIQAVELQQTNNGTSLDGVATETHLQDGQNNEAGESLKKVSNAENFTANMVDSEDNNSDPKKPEEPHLKVDKLERDTNLIKKESNEETQQKPNIWGSLKSFADGFINILKKL